jgi:hypothetical protein
MLVRRGSALGTGRTDENMKDTLLPVCVGCATTTRCVPSVVGGKTKEKNDENLSDTTRILVKPDVLSTLMIKKRGSKGESRSRKFDAATETVVPPKVLPNVGDADKIDADGTVGSTVILND